MSGWSTSRQGYLPESELSFDLAIFCKLSELEPKPIQRMLKSTPRSYFKKAFKFLQYCEKELQELREVQPIIKLD